MTDKLVKLLVDKTYPAAWVFNYPKIRAGTVVPVAPATNQPNYKEKGLYWIDTDELKDDPYGILIESGEYEEV